MRSVLLFIVLAIVIQFPAPTGAETFVVRPDGMGDLPTIQAAIDSAAAGDVIELTDGTFQGNGNRDLDYVGKAITVRSQSDNPAVCVIDCAGSEGEHHRGFLFQSGEGPSSILHGVRVINGFATNGGAIECRSSSSPRILDCEFENNEAINEGGAVNCIGVSSPELVTCRFSLNRSGSNGGAVALYGATGINISGCSWEGNTSGEYGGAIYWWATGFASVSDCSFAGNTALNGNGGALFCQGWTTTFQRCMFSDNSSNGSWGGGAAVFYFPAELEIIDCGFSDNAANESSLGGGGLLFYQGSSTQLDDCTFDANGCSGPSASGGGVRCFQSIMELNSCSLVDNFADSNGGGLAITGSTSDVTLETCTIAGNWADDTGGGLSSLDSSPVLRNCTLFSNGVGSPDGGGHLFIAGTQVTIINSILAFSTSGAAIACLESSTAELSCCDVHGNANGDWVGCIAGQSATAGNIEEDPLFCVPDSGILTLHEDSPCAPFTPPNEECDLIGAWPVGCGPTTGIFDEPWDGDSRVLPSSWGGIKAGYR